MRALEKRRYAGHSRIAGAGRLNPLEVRRILGRETFGGCAECAAPFQHLQNHVDVVPKARVGCPNGDIQEGFQKINTIMKIGNSFLKLGKSASKIKIILGRGFPSLWNRSSK